MINGIEFLIDMDDAKKEAEKQLLPLMAQIHGNEWRYLIKERTKVILLGKENKELKQILNKSIDNWMRLYAEFKASREAKI